MLQRGGLAVPNGHGGIPRYGSPVLLLLALGALAVLEVRRHPAWVSLAAYATAALLGWRLAWHLFLYPMLEYDGAYASPAELAAARRRYRLAAAVAIPLAVGLAVVGWRALR